ncbi:MAG TPA: hypothetical protein VLR26_05680 [Frankiaceae bacterium]|nr:hypothetical protein [Frankiaceae bacterium]
MIVISGALVVVAAVLLLLGFITSNLTFIYAAIGLSVVSGLFLLFGILQPHPPQRTPRSGGRPRRDDREGTPKRRRSPEGKAQGEGGESEQQSGGQVPAQSGTDGNATGAAAAAAGAGAAAAASQHGNDQQGDASQQGSKQQGADAPEDPFAGEPGVEEVPDAVASAAEASGMPVRVVSGHPRYHLEHCSVVVGDPELEPLDIAEAKELGFTPCAVCAPDQHLGGHAADPGGAAPAQAQDQGQDQGQQHQPSQNGHAPVFQEGPQNGGLAPSQEAPTAAFSVPQAQQGSPFATQQMPVQQPQQQVQGQQVHQVQQAQHQAPVQESPAGAQPAETVEPPPASFAPIGQPQQAQQAQQQAAAEQPAPPPAAPAPPPAAPAAPAAPVGRAKTVVTVSGRSDYHRPDCSAVQGQQQESLSRVAAIRQGYFACSICKP